MSDLSAIPPGFETWPEKEQALYLMRARWLASARADQLPPEGSWLVWLLLAGRGFGKLLATDTPVPTPSGWTTMGALRVGDQVFDEAGKPCNVTWVSPTQTDKTFRLTFSDNSELIAGASHQWGTWTHAERKAFLRSPYEDATRFPTNWPTWRLRRSCGGADPKIYEDSPGPRVRTTQQIHDTLTFAARKDTNHCIPNAGPLQLPAVELPIDPYVLGAWLGDGDTNCAAFTAHEDDQPHLRFWVELAGTPTTDYSHPQRFGTLGLQVKLREAGVLGNKHIPPAYLRASAEQRLALLAGLMDTDGGWEAAGTVSFSSSLEHLADAAYELVVSLGMRATKNSRIPKCNGKPGQRNYQITFTPTVNVFWLPRKSERLTFCAKQALRKHHRMIVAADEIPLAVPMKCITVDSPNSMYLVGKGMIPTHNTRTASEHVAFEGMSNDNWRIGVVAPTFQDVRDTCFEGESGIISILGGPTSKHIHKWNRSMGELELMNGTIFKGFPGDEPDRLRGPQFHLTWVDELAAMSRQDEAWANIEMCTRLGIDPRIIVTTTPRPTKLIRELIKRSRPPEPEDTARALTPDEQSGPGVPKGARSISTRSPFLDAGPVT